MVSAIRIPPRDTAHSSKIRPLRNSSRLGDFLRGVNGSPGSGRVFFHEVLRILRPNRFRPLWVLYWDGGDLYRPKALSLFTTASGLVGPDSRLFLCILEVGRSHVAFSRRSGSVRSGPFLANREGILFDAPHGDVYARAGRLYFFRKLRWPPANRDRSSGGNWVLEWGF